MLALPLTIPPRHPRSIHLCLLRLQLLPIRRETPRRRVSAVGSRAATSMGTQLGIDGGSSRREEDGESYDSDRDAYVWISPTDSSLGYSIRVETVRRRHDSASTSKKPENRTNQRLGRRDLEPYQSVPAHGERYNLEPFSPEDRRRLHCTSNDAPRQTASWQFSSLHQPVTKHLDLLVTHDY
jgi:hypothetical protein